MRGVSDVSVADNRLNDTPAVRTATSVLSGANDCVTSETESFVMLRVKGSCIKNQRDETAKIPRHIASLLGLSLCTGIGLSFALKWLSVF